MSHLNCSADLILQLIPETVWAFVGMNKIEFNPRKARHIKYLERRIVELHQEIFDDALFLATNYDANLIFTCVLDKRRNDIQTKISLQKKYRRRLKLLNL